MKVNEFVSRGNRAAARDRVDLQSANLPGVYLSSYWAGYDLASSWDADDLARSFQNIFEDLKEVQDFKKNHNLYVRLYADGITHPRLYLQMDLLAGNPLSLLHKEPFHFFFGNVADTHENGRSIPVQVEKVSFDGNMELCDMLNNCYASICKDLSLKLQQIADTSHMLRDFGISSGDLSMIQDALGQNNLLQMPVSSGKERKLLDSLIQSAQSRINNSQSESDRKDKSFIRH